MIRAPGSTAALRPAEQYAIDVLIDLACLLPVDDPAADVVRLEVTERPDDARELTAWITAGWGIEPADGVVPVPRVELGRKGQGRRAVRTAAAALAAIGRDPVWRGVTEILAREAARAIRSTWFILCGTPTLSTMTRGDLTYRPESARARRILEAIQGAGHAIGLHGSFATMEADGLFG